MEENARLQRAFFNEKAPLWRENGEDIGQKVQKLLSEIPLEEGQSVLDVACGSGILERFLSPRLKTDAVDISENMIEKAERLNGGSGARFFVGDFYALEKSKAYDALLVFDSYPHFTDKRLFAEQAFRLLKEGGILWIFFDQSKEEINGRHGGCDPRLSVRLRGARQEAEVFLPDFELLRLQDDGEGYCIGLRKKLRQIF